MPTPGRYGLTVQGTENVQFGPLSFCERALPKSSELVIAPAEGEPDGSYNVDVRYYPDSPGQHDERAIYRYGSDAVGLVFESAAVTCSGVRQSSEVSHAEPQVAVQLPLREGDSWSGTSGDAKRRVTYRAKVTGTEKVAIGGRRFETFVIEMRSTFSGAEKGERVLRWWYSPELAMPLRWQDEVSGSRSGATYRSKFSVSVNSLPAGTR